MSLFSDLNEVQLLGNAVSEPELKRTPKGTAVAQLNIATNRDFKVGDEWQKETTYTRVVLWAKLAEQAAERINKGTRVLIKGRLSVRSWDDKESGKKQYRTEIIATDLVLIARYNSKEGTAQPNAEYDGSQDVIDNTQLVEDTINPDDLPF